MDTRENANEDPNIIVMGWQRKQEKTKGELWEKEHQYEETILTRRSQEVAKIRWTSPKLLLKEEPVTPDSGDTLDESNTVIDIWYESSTDMTDITGERSNMEEDDATHNLQVDSSKWTLKEWTEVDNVAEKTQEVQSQREVRGRTTPYVFLPLQELDKLRATIRKTLRE